MSASAVKIFVGMEGGRRPVLARAKELGAPILISANSLWNNDKKTFRGGGAYAGLEIVLDCGGFVAMQRYGGYRWSVEQYAQLAKSMAPVWWAQMDFCCEPEIATQRAAVFKRIDSTVEYLNECQAVARRIGGAMPMPVLQGWAPQDYCSGPIYDKGFEWPSLVGVGSVCRRPVSGPTGIVAVINAIDQKIPKHVKLHLFGVKSTALQVLLTHFSHRIESVDSMAWNVACRKDAFNQKIPCDGQMRADYMGRWYEKQAARLSNPQLTFSLN